MVTPLETAGQDRRAKSDRRCRTSQEGRWTRYHSWTRFCRAGLAGEEPEAVEEDLAGGESGLSADDRPDGLAEHGATRGLEHQANINQFQAFISRLYMEKGSESWIRKNCTL